MEDLVRWLGQQLDDDERIARAAGGLAWHRPEDPWEFAVAIRDSEGERVVCIEGWPSEGQGVHIVAHDPARVLREIDSKRRLLAHYIKAAQAVEELTATRERLRLRGQDLLMTEMELESAIHRRDTLHGVVCVLAAVYADREGYEEGWAP